MIRAGNGVGIDDFYLARPRIRGMARYVQNLKRVIGDELQGLSPLKESASGTAWRRLACRVFPTWEQFILPRVITERRLGACIFPYNTGPIKLASAVGYIVVIHDTIFLGHSALKGSPGRVLGASYRRLVSRQAAARADLILTVSNTTRELIINQYLVDETRVKTVYNTVTAAFAQAAQSGRGIPSGYLLSVTGTSPNKNLARLLESYAVYRQTGGTLRLRVAGLSDKEVLAFEHKRRSRGDFNGVEFLGMIDDTQLVEQYRNANGFVFPSIEEGFGIPLIEAMACKIPIACSGSSCLPEIAGDAALYFDPNSVEAMARAMDALGADTAGNRRRVVVGSDRFCRFAPAAFEERVKSVWELIKSEICR